MDNAFDPLESTKCMLAETCFENQPVPDCASSTPQQHFQLGAPSARWAYRDSAGKLLGFVCRFELIDIGKAFRPLFWGRWNGKTGWYWKAPKTPRPLYNLPALETHPTAEVIVTEGEKAADSATAHFPDHVAVSPMNGAKSPTKADWSPLIGRHVIVWGDYDEPGKMFGHTVASLCQKIGAASVRIIEMPTAFPEKWDLADPLPEGWAVERLRTLLGGAAPPKQF